MALNSIEEIIADIRAGKMVILMDDEDRENEGDLIMAAEHITPEAINFMARYGRGLICLTLTGERCEQLQLPLMVDNNQEVHSTNFTVSIEAASGVTTGISAADRATTVQAAVAEGASAADLVQPGHIFPLRAQDGGVLTRAGHTEAGCDLARLAGLTPASVIVEILNEDGTMARRPDLEVFARQHDLKIGTVASLIEYRNLNETTIERVASCQLPTEHGEFTLHTYKDTIDGAVHMALIRGEVQAEQPTLVRVHLQNTLADLLGATEAGASSWPLSQAMARIAGEGGVLVLLGNHETPDELVHKVQDLARQADGQPVRHGREGASRRIGVGSQILADLGVKKMRLMSAQTRYHALSGFGLEVVDYLPYG